jgi:hypothetical protein
MSQLRSRRIQFDSQYYDRFYHSRTRVSSPLEVGRLARMVLTMIDWLDFEIATVLDVGAGPGLWRDWFAKHRPMVLYRSTDVSAYACKRYGHERKDIVRWRARTEFGLVICQGVLPYLRNADAEAALENLAAMTGGFLYLEAVTRHDLESVCQQDHTDLRMIPRTGTWYRKRLEKHYKCLGFGLWVKRDLDTRLYELEAGR